MEADARKDGPRICSRHRVAGDIQQIALFAPLPVSTSPVFEGRDDVWVLVAIDCKLRYSTQEIDVLFDKAQLINGGINE